MPVISVIGDTTPDPYVVESTVDIDDSDWDAFSLANKYNAWPAKDFCLPWIEQPDRFGEVSKGDEWFYYAGTLNRYFASTGQIVRNSFADGDFDSDPATPDTREFFNNNVVVPCVFLLSPIANALESIGYKIAGDMVDDPKAQKTFIIPKEDQLTAIKDEKAPVVSSYDGLSFLASVTIRRSVGFSFTYTNNTVQITYLIENLGAITIDVQINASNVDLLTENVLCTINLDQGNDSVWITERFNPDQGLFDFSATIDPTIEDLGKTVYVYYTHGDADPAVLPQSSAVTITQEAYPVSLYRIHPTIELSRFTPDITVANYINDLLKNWHNLRITIDDVKQIVYLDYNEAFIGASDAPVILKDLYLKDFIPNQYETFYITYAGDDGESILIDSTGVVANGEPTDSTKRLEIKVKPAPHNGTTTAITSDFLNDSGTTVALYNTTSGLPYTTPSVNNKTLSLQGTGGMYESNFKAWLRFRINASTQTVQVAISSIQLQEIRDKGKVYFDNQRYLVSSIQYTEGSHVKNVTIDLESVNF